MDNILIFGGSGCLGKHLIKKYINTYNIINYSRDEHKHWYIDIEFGKGKIKHIIGDANNATIVRNTLIQYNPCKIFIIHALKHVDRCQDNIDACINTNLLSVKTILDTVHAFQLNLTNLKEVIFTSTDKAPSPVNAYGMCKALCEELMINKSKQIPNIKFLTVRYGNVLNSTGSIIQTLLNSKEDTFYITDIKMTRFWMTIDDAINTIEYAIYNGESGDIIIPKAKSFYVKDLIYYFAKLQNKKVEISGIRPGERLYETLINDTQMQKTISKDKYYHISPNIINNNNNIEVYDSNTNLITDKNELEALLVNIIT